MKPVERVRIFDTTLRDGEQGAGASMSKEDKVAIAQLLEAMGVDVIEAGFPAASEGAAATVTAIAAACTRAQVCALARGTYADIDAAVRSLRPAGERARIHVFIATDKEHMAKKLRLDPATVLDRIATYVAYAKRFIDDIEFSPEVATTSDVAFLLKSIDVAVAAGATIVNIPDTTGYALPHEYGALIRTVVDHLAYAPQVLVSAHCHDDRGLATANTLEGVRNGARQVECTVNGIGERAGNTSLEEVVMAFTLRPEVYGVVHGIDTTHLCIVSALVARASRLPVPPNKAFVGISAFAHESGIHQDGVLKDPRLYEICAPELVGAVRRLPLSKLSGKAGLAATLVRLGYVPTEPTLDLAYQQCMAYADVHQALPDDVVHRIVHALTG